MPSKITAGRLPSKGQRPGDHLVEHGTEREQIAARVESSPRACSGDMKVTVPTAVPGLVRCSGAMQRSSLRAACDRRPPDRSRLRQTEVENLRLAVGW